MVSSWRRRGCRGACDRLSARRHHSRYDEDGGGDDDDDDHDHDHHSPAYRYLER
jgi:hypothetical protein